MRRPPRRRSNRHEPTRHFQVPAVYRRRRAELRTGGSYLTALCRKHLLGRHEIDVVDVFREPKRALEDGIFMTPTLVKLAPSPALRIVGTLSETQTVLQALGVESVAV